MIFCQWSFLTKDNSDCLGRDAEKGNLDKILGVRLLSAYGDHAFVLCNVHIYWIAYLLEKALEHRGFIVGNKIRNKIIHALNGNTTIKSVVSKFLACGKGAQKCRSAQFFPDIPYNYD